MKIAIASLIISICSALGTLANWIYTAVKNSKNIRVEIINIGVQGNLCLMSICFENLSRLPISITRFSLKLNDCLIDCDRLSAVYSESTKRSRGEVVERIAHNTLPFPINLDSYAAQSGVLRFQDQQGNLRLLSNKVTARVCTNRGKVDEIELLLPQIQSLEEWYQHRT